MIVFLIEKYEEFAAIRTVSSYFFRKNSSPGGVDLKSILCYCIFELIQMHSTEGTPKSQFKEAVALYRRQKALE
jgi:hypothetical protein